MATSTSFHRVSNSVHASNAQLHSPLPNMKQNLRQVPRGSSIKSGTQNNFAPQNGSQAGFQSTKALVLDPSLPKSSPFNVSSAPSSGTHKDYIKNMLTQKYAAKYAKNGTDSQAMVLINNEIFAFLRQEKLNKENVNRLEKRIEEKLALKQTQGGGGSNLQRSGLQQLNSGKLSKNVSKQYLNPESKEQEYQQLEQQLNLSQKLKDMNYTAPYREYLSQQDTNFVRDLLDNYVTKAKDDAHRVDQDIKDNLSEPDEWREVDKYRQLVYDHDEQMRKTKLQEQKREVKGYLDDQVREKIKKRAGVTEMKQRQDQVVLSQVKQYQMDQDRVKLENERKMNREKQIRDFQIKEVRDQKREIRSQKKEYERQLVEELQGKIQQDKEREVQRRENLKVLAEEMKRENEANKQLRNEERQRLREMDVRLAKEYIEMVDGQERKKREEFQERIRKQQEFMTRMEQNVVQQENKKQKLLEDNIKNYEQRRQREDQMNEDRAKKAIVERQIMLKEGLTNQVAQKNAQKQFHKFMNGEQVDMFKEKVRRDEQKEREELDEIKRKSRECQDFILQQIEEKKARQKGMTKDEFQFNKDLLKEIASKKSELRNSVMKTQEVMKERSQLQAAPAYQIYNL